jgi:hypothetical protein
VQVVSPTRAKITLEPLERGFGHTLGKGDASFTPGLPESFNVLIRELQALCLDVDLIKTKRRVADLPPAPPAAEPEPVAG